MSAVDMVRPENGSKSCRRCGQEFKPYRAWQVFCSPQCRHTAYNARHPDPDVRCHMAHISPDVNMGGLLKETRDSQLFTVFGLPRTEVRRTDNGEYVVEMQGVDIYDPVSNSLQSASANQVAAWFLDSDYDGRTFCITQAFFPDVSAWDKLSRALKASIPEEAFSAFSGTVSLPFPAGKHGRVAVKVIDPRGNEVMSVHQLDGVHYG